MAQYKYDDIEALQEIVSEELGAPSAELEITQDMVNQFADLSGDDYWLHTDPEKCKEMSPFGCTVAHGFLTLIVLSKLQSELGWEVTGFNNMLNYGSDKLRFTGVVPVGAKIVARRRVKEVSATPKGTKIVMENHVYVVGQERPALIYDMIFMYM